MEEPDEFAGQRIISTLVGALVRIAEGTGQTKVVE
jgi:hypothetical protein